MLSFEREVVEALGTAPDEETRSAVEAFVDGTLRAMPELIRWGVVAETMTFGSYARLRGGDVGQRLDRWETSRIGVVRQYVHLFRSLVLFGENELAAPAPTAPSPAPAGTGR